MTTPTDHVSIHMPKYETGRVHFKTPTPGVTVDIADIQNFVREKAEKNLEQCEAFEVSLPPSITGITSESNRIEFQSLFQTPTLNELELVSTNPDGSHIRLNANQLAAVQQTGEFEVDSIHFPGQRHRWRLSKLLQSGTLTANQKFFKELSWALYMLIIFARDRVFSNTFSFKATLRSWRQGVVSLIDALVGLPAVQSSGIDLDVEIERSKFLVTGLSPHSSEREMHEAFCAQLPLLLEVMEEHAKYTRRKNKPPPPRMLPYPHHFVTPNNIDIDLRLHNPDLQAKIKSIVGPLLVDNNRKHWFNSTKRRLINEYKHAQKELNLTKEQIAERVQTQLNNEYTERSFELIERSPEIERLSPGLGALLIAQARAVLTMRAVANQLNADLEKHLKDVRARLTREHPIKSKISRWMDRQLLAARLTYVHQHEWDAHQLSIEQCKALGNQQAAYFIQRDLTFRKDHESVLRTNLRPTVSPIKTITCTRRIWFPKNWVIERTYPLPIEQIPTQFEKHTYSPEEEEHRRQLVQSDPDAQYNLRKTTVYSTTTRYPFWRWKLFALRGYSWLSNTFFFLCVAVPLASPVSFRALFSVKPFQPDYELNRANLKLREHSRAKTQTFVSRLVALWNHIRNSRRKFEQAPDRGFLGKNVQRIFNQVWNYFFKGVIGTIGICIVYPVTCLVVPVSSFILGVLSPIWVPIGTVLFHLLQIIFYDSSSAGEYGRKLFCVINIIMTDIVCCGIIQPILVVLALLASPIISLSIVIFALLHRCSRGLYDKVIYEIVVKRCARIPANNGFLARRVAGPGLAAEYFYQVSSPEVLAALESLIEQNELKVYRTYVERLLMKPVDEYREFFNRAFRPFSAVVEVHDDESVFARMNTVVNKHTEDLRKTIERRNELLRVRRGNKHERIRLTETDLTAVLLEGTQLVQKWYPRRILPYFSKDEIEKFWNDWDLETDDWFGLTSKLLQELFCRDFLTPLEQTDVFYSLKVDHITLSKYAHMINSASLHDDLDVVTSVYLPETSFTIHQPSFDEQILDPNERILTISTNYTGKHHHKSHGRAHRFFNRKANYLKHANDLARFVDYTSMTCRFSIPIHLPAVICINVIVYNRDRSNGVAANPIGNVTYQRLLELIDFNKKFYTQAILPTYSTIVTSPSLQMTASTDDDDVILVSKAAPQP